MSAVVYLVGLGVIGALAYFVAVPLLERSSVRRRSMDEGELERYRLEREKELAYSAIKEAEFDYQMGKLSPEDYALLRERFEARALAAIGALERSS